MNDHNSTWKSNGKRDKLMEIKPYEVLLHMYDEVDDDGKRRYGKVIIKVKIPSPDDIGQGCGGYIDFTSHRMNEETAFQTFLTLTGKKGGYRIRKGKVELHV